MPKTAAKPGAAETPAKTRKAGPGLAEPPTPSAELAATIGAELRAVFGEDRATTFGMQGLLSPHREAAWGRGGRLRDLGSSLTAMSLIIRDRIAQSAADFLVVHLGIGPFGVATGLLRLAGVLQAATITTRAISGHLHWSSSLDIVMAGVFCWVCFVWAKLTAAAARRPPRFGSITASALRRDEYLVLVLMIVAFVGWDLVDMMRGASFEDSLTTASDLIQGLGFLLGSTLWRDLPGSGRRSPVPAGSTG